MIAVCIMFAPPKMELLPTPMISMIIKQSISWAEDQKHLMLTIGCSPNLSCNVCLGPVVLAQRRSLGTETLQSDEVDALMD